MKKFLFLLIFFFGFSSYVSAADYTKNSACGLKDGYYYKSLSVSYPGYVAKTFEFIKKGGKLVYFVHLGEYPTNAIYAYEYSCTNKKTQQLGESMGNGLYVQTELEGASENWIIGHTFMGDMCGGIPSIEQTFVNRINGEHKNVNFSKFTGFNTILSKLNFKSNDMGIQTFGSTSNPNIFNAVLVRNSECGGDEYSGKNKTTKVIVDISNRTITLPQNNSIRTGVTTKKNNYPISEFYRFQDGIVQYKAYIQGVGRYQWYDTDIDASTMVLLSPKNGRDKHGSFDRDVHLTLNGSNTSFTPIGNTSTFSSDFWTDGLTDQVYVKNSGYSSLGILPGAKASALNVFDQSYDIQILKKYCNSHGDDFELYDMLAMDNNNCYGTYGSTPGNQIVKKIERIK